MEVGQLLKIIQKGEREIGQILIILETWFLLQIYQYNISISTYSQILVNLILPNRRLILFTNV